MLFRSVVVAEADGAEDGVEETVALEDELPGVHADEVTGEEGDDREREVDHPAPGRTPGDPVGEREAERIRTLAGRRDADLWVFGYGSLMWDPALRFEEVRRAHVPGYARRFILKDVYGGRGSVDAPGLMVALDRGAGCEGLAFRVSRENIEVETEVLWRRERIGPAYAPVFVEAIVGGPRIVALTFVADHEAELIVGGITRAQQIEYCATGTGFLGSSLDYLKSIHRQFVALGIRDDEVAELLRETEAYLGS